jgi:hypothetical protein
LRLRHEADETDIAAERGRDAAFFAKALINLDAAENMLIEYASEIRRAAVAAVEAARANGLDIQLEKVGFRPVSAWQLTGGNWKQAAYHVMAAVTVRHTSAYLRQETTTFWVEEPGDVAKQMDDLVKEQRFRQIRVAQLEAVGADFLVDQITLDILEAHGLVAKEVLAGVTNIHSTALTVHHEGQDVRLSLINHLGKVTISMATEDAVWNGEYLWFLGDEEMKDHKHLIGKSLGHLLRHPAFASRLVADVVRSNVDLVIFEPSRRLFFDADSGRIWEDETLGGLLEPENTVTVS